MAGEVTATEPASSSEVAPGRRPSRRRSLRFRLTVIVTGLFAVALLTAGAVTREYLRNALERDAREAATALLDDFLTPSQNMFPTVDEGELTRWLYRDADGQPVGYDRIEELFDEELRSQFPGTVFVGGSVESSALLPTDVLSGPALGAEILGGPVTLDADGNIIEGPIFLDADGNPVDDIAASVAFADIQFPFADAGPLRDVDVEDAIAVGRDVTLAGDRITVIVASPTSTIDDSVATVTLLGALGIPVLTALVAVITWVVTARTLRPVEAIRRQVERTDPSRLDHHVPRQGSGDEIDRLAGTMNDMLDRLHASSVQQRRFISDASHELRSPITATLATVESTRPEEVAERWPELASTIIGEQRRLQQLVDNLLLLAELDERPTDLAASGSVDLDELVLDEVARPRVVPVHAHIAAPHRVSGSARLLGRALTNLVDNAARHATTCVDVTVTTDDEGSAIVQVDDDGPGVPEADRASILARFTRLDEARRRREGGAGLGLAIVHEIVSQHGARLVIGDSPSGGARFEIVYPTA